MVCSLKWKISNKNSVGKRLCSSTRIKDATVPKCMPSIASLFPIWSEHDIIRQKIIINNRKRKKTDRWRRCKRGNKVASVKHITATRITEICDYTQQGTLFIPSNRFILFFCLCRWALFSLSSNLTFNVALFSNFCFLSMIYCSVPLLTLTFLC